MSRPDGPSAEDISRAAQAGKGVIRDTPVLNSRTLSERAGAKVVMKAENLQRTGSFKLRGALAKIAALGDGSAAGVVTGSAGNHAQGLVYAAQARGVASEVFMPEGAPISKIEAVTSLGATVRLVGETVDESLVAARERAAQGSLAFVHPFDDPDVIAGQGTIGLELLEQVPDITRVLVPVGGGGLISGIAIALKSARADIQVIGVQVDTCAPFPASLKAGLPVPVESAVTIADGIAVKRPGELTLELIRRWVDEVVVVSEDDVGEAMWLLVERSKLVVEGAGAVGVAALLAGRAPGIELGSTVVILSGGNVDAGLLAAVAHRHETQSGRRLVLMVRVPDRPGALARLLALVGAHGANLREVQHIREGIDLHVRETAVQLMLETRSLEHGEEVARAVREEGYDEAVLVARGARFASRGTCAPP